MPLRARAPAARADQAKISPEESCRKARIHSLVRAGMPKTVGGTRIVRPVHAGGRAPSARAHREAVKDLNARLSEKGTNDRVRPQRFRDPCSSLRKGARSGIILLAKFGSRGREHVRAHSPDVKMLALTHSDAGGRDDGSLRFRGRHGS